MFWSKRSYSVIQTDIHSHLIPGIDDGARNADDAILLLGRMEKLGFQRVITTPHIHSSIYPNTNEIILDGFFDMRTKIRESGLSIKLGIAAEYFIDSYLFELIEKGELFSLPGRYILIEMSPFGTPTHLADCIFNLCIKNYKPLIAHPERYLFLQKDFAQALLLKEQGCYFQVNLLSLTGYYGKKIKECAVKFYKSGLIDFWGTDVHNLRHVDQLEKALRSRRFYNMIKNTKIKNHTLNNYKAVEITTAE